MEWLLSLFLFLLRAEDRTRKEDQGSLGEMRLRKETDSWFFFLGPRKGKTDS